MEIGLFMMPNHPPERSPYDAMEWDLQVLHWADEYGLSEAWIGEHFTVRWESCPAPDLLIAQALRETTRIKLAPGAHLLPYHHPVELAHRVAYLDQLAKGRYMLGVGAGAYVNDGKLFNVDIRSGDNRKMMRESLDIMRRIWEAEEPFEFHGNYWSCAFPEFDPITGGPYIKPYQKPYPPIGIAGFTPRSSTLTFGGEQGFIPLSINLNPGFLNSHWEAYVEGASSAGRTADRREWRIAQEFFVADTDEEAMRLALDGMMGRACREAGLPLWKAWNVLKLVADGFGIQEADVSCEYLAKNVWLVGSPETVVRKLERQFEATGGFGTLLGISLDYMENPGAWHHSVELMATEVLPKVKGLVPPPPLPLAKAALKV